jgi:hypothetical protein
MNHPTDGQQPLPSVPSHEPDPGGFRGADLRPEGFHEMIFQIDGKSYRGASAVEIVRALERDAADYSYPGQMVRQFLLWSLSRLRDRVPPRELALSDRLDDEALAFSYLCLCDEYGVGELLVDSS